MSVPTAATRPIRSSGRAPDSPPSAPSNSTLASSPFDSHLEKAVARTVHPVSSRSAARLPAFSAPAASRPSNDASVTSKATHSESPTPRPPDLEEDPSGSSQEDHPGHLDPQSATPGPTPSGCILLQHAPSPQPPTTPTPGVAELPRSPIAPPDHAPEESSTPASPELPTPPDARTKDRTPGAKPDNAATKHATEACAQSTASDPPKTTPSPAEGAAQSGAGRLPTSAILPPPSSAPHHANPPQTPPILPTPPPPTGISTASSVDVMHGESVMANSAGGTEQILPAEVSRLPELNDAKATGHHAARMSQSFDIENIAQAGQLGSSLPGSTEVAPADTAIATPAADPTDRVLAAMKAAVVRFHRTGDDDYQVSIRPDPETEIRLRVTLHAGSTEIHAELRRGDGGALTEQWKDLQDRLGRQGIQLADLSSSPESTQTTLSGGSSGSAFSHRHRTRESETDAVPAFETSNRRRNSPTSAAVLRRLNGWETWA